MTNDLMRMGALISGDVAAGKAPIILAMRSEPVDDADSRWQFTGGETDNLETEEPQIWLVSEVIDLDPSISAFIDSPYGARLTRASPQASWKRI